MNIHIAVTIAIIIACLRSCVFIYCQHGYVRCTHIYIYTYICIKHIHIYIIYILRGPTFGLL